MPTKNQIPRKDKTNATLRLSLILDAMSHNGDSASVADTLAKVLKITPSEGIKHTLQAVVVLARMIETAERESRFHYPEEWDTVGPHFAGIRACFDPRRLGAAWNQHKSSLTSADLTGIRHTAVHLKRHVHENAISDGDLAEVRAAIEEMSQALEDEALSSHTRKILRERLDAIEMALDEYRYWGSPGIESAYRDLAGTIAIDPVFQNDLSKDSNKEDSLGKKVMRVILALTAILTLANASADAAKKFLPFFGPPAHSISSPDPQLPGEDGSIARPLHHSDSPVKRI
jgi:hypothetical protein